ncbi:alpha-mannosidase [Aureimonas endophytica]|uniref:Alpha-mannosidase n=1 Tax=Aureimonas endophytica TaxID=2027858 RepID=A0A917ECC0_9HYPH|nr:glycoside hydrolase family 38 C-terminal domain-containing protein [Aureimonas endophytica]GGE23045.1 alpha-mannosidase [Aureimonas endophytica]
MSLTLAQRIDRLDVRSRELPFWRERASLPITDWTFDGEPLTLGAPWPRRDGVFAFAASAEVPEGWTLDETRLILDLGGESLITLVGETGEKSYGLDPYHREFAVPGRRFGIRSETVARLPFGEPVKEPRLVTARLAWIEPALHGFHLLLRQLVETARLLGAHEVVAHLVAAGEEAFAALDWPSATADYVARMGDFTQGRAIWGLPPLKERPEGLTETQRAGVVRAHEGLVAALQGLKARYPQQGRIALTGHAHIDLAWLWPYAETRRKTRRTFHTALRLMEDFPSYVFNQSTAAYYAQIEEDDPALFEAIREAVKAGQWETIGGMWVEPDTNMPTGESFVRQILYGQRYFERTFGTRHRVCWLPDCFGFSPALPQLLRQGGMDSFFTIKVNWSETNRFPHDLFLWEGLDGSRVLAHTFDNPQNGYNGSIEPAAILPTWGNFRRKDIHDESLLAVGWGDGGGGTTPEMLERQAQLADFPIVPALRPVRVEDFFARIHDEVPEERLPVWSGEIYLELHRATLTSQSHTKRLHRHAERALITAETVASLATLLGAAAPASLEPVWRTVLKNEFHDILPGSGIREIYDDAERELTESLAAAEAAKAEGLAALAARLPKGGLAEALVVVNPDLHARAIRAEIDGAPVTAETALPGLGILVLDPRDLAAPSDLSVSASHLENRFVRIEIGADGTLTRLFDKRTSREALAGRGNQLWVYPMDKPRDWDAWDLEDDYRRGGIELTHLDGLDLVESGPHRVALRLRRRFRDSTITQELRLWANSPRLEIRTELDWHDRRVLLRAETPVDVRSDFATFECAFGVVRRATHDNTSWDAAKFEVPAHRFADLSEPGFGVALLNDAKYGHSVKGNVLGLSLVRAPIYPDPMADEGAQSFTYALMPHGGDWREGGVREEALDLNQPVLATKAGGLAAGLVQPLVATGIAAGLAGLKVAEDGQGLVARVYEPAGARGPFTLRPAEGWRVEGDVNLLEEPVTRETGPDLKPFEVRSWRLARE